MSIKVSVIVPIYNEEKYLDECLSTLIDQTYSNIEIIVVDDDSKDNSKNIVMKYPVKYLHQSHAGPAIAKNLGAKHASGEILVFGDGDIYYDKDFVNNLIKPIITNQAIGTYSKEMYVANPENIWSQCYNVNVNLDADRKVSENFPDAFTGFKAIRKDKFLEVGGFDNVGYGEDLTLYPKLRIKSQSAKRAISYHYNPDSFNETFITARWVGRGNDNNLVISIARMVKYSLPLSLTIGLFKSARFRKPFFIYFKVIWDLGVLIGIINSLTKTTHAK